MQPPIFEHPDPRGDPQADAVPAKANSGYVDSAACVDVAARLHGAQVHRRQLRARKVDLSLEKRGLQAHSEHEHRLAGLSTEIAALEQRILRYAVGAGATVVTIGLTAARLIM